MGYLKGLSYMTLWICSILAGYAIFFCPLLPVVFISNRWYRKITDYLLTFWQMYPSALLVFLHGCEIHVTGDPINSDESILMVMNHRTRTDWNYLWPAVSRATIGRNSLLYPTKFVLKDSIRHVPGVGWMMQLGSYIYIKRNWVEDQKKMEKAINFFSELKSTFSVLIFPEGTDLTANTISNSNKYADKMGLPHYENVLHPRTTGFCFLARKMIEKQQLDAIYDATIVYVDMVPQNERSLITADLPKHVCIHFQRYTPCEGATQACLQKFLETRWSEKEQTLADFKSSNRKTLFDSKAEINVRPYRCNLLIALIFWTFLPLPVGYLIYTSKAFRYLVLAHTAFLLLVNYFSDGFQSFEIGVHETKKSIRRLFIHEHHDN